MNKADQAFFTKPRISPHLTAFHLSLQTMTNFMAYGMALWQESALGQKQPVSNSLSLRILLESWRQQLAFLQGILAYETHPRPSHSPYPAPIWEHHQTRLYDFGQKYGASAKAQPLLLVPSLINRSYVFDLLKNKGFLAFLSQKGVRPYVLDWGQPKGSAHLFTLNDYGQKRLVPALHWLHQRHQAPLPVVGYCMGGLMALIGHQLAPQHVKALGFLATPWDFHQSPFPKKSLSAFRPFLENHPHSDPVPSHWLQLFFHTLSPFDIQRKFSSFLTLQHQKGPQKEVSLFIEIEDWLNDPVPVSLSLLKECFEHWYVQNKTHLEGVLAGHTLKPAPSHLPSLMVTPLKDRLVPAKSAQALSPYFPSADHLAPPLGHLGLFTSSKAPELFWEPFYAWIQKLSTH